MKVVQRGTKYARDFEYVFAIGESIRRMSNKSPNEKKFWYKNFEGEGSMYTIILNIEVSDGEESQESIS
jgi:hypothetical protein